MRIAVASGKGGTGKTTVAVSLALSLQEREAERHGAGAPLLFVDCDVEAPDAHLFLHPELQERVSATVPVPRIDAGRCTLCGDCVEVCRFNAMALLGDEVRLFPELCHGCGSCRLICSPGAIEEEVREIGTLESGWAHGIRFAQGTVNVGEPLAVPVIRQLKEWVSPGPGHLTILDSPPGTSCPMVETVTESDFVLLVTEPTPAGLHDLELAEEVLREMKIPAGVIVNRDGTGYEKLEESCATRGLPVLLRIPFDRGIAEGLARGETLVGIRPEYRVRLWEMVEDIREVVERAELSRPESHMDMRKELDLIQQGREA